MPLEESDFVVVGGEGNAEEDEHDHVIVVVPDHAVEALPPNAGFRISARELVAAALTLALILWIFSV